MPGPSCLAKFGLGLTMAWAMPGLATGPAFVTDGWAATTGPDPTPAAKAANAAVHEEVADAALLRMGPRRPSGEGGHALWQSPAWNSEWTRPWNSG